MFSILICFRKNNYIYEINIIRKKTSGLWLIQHLKRKSMFWLSGTFKDCRSFFRLCSTFWWGQPCRCLGMWSHIRWTVLRCLVIPMLSLAATQCGPPFPLSVRAIVGLWGSWLAWDYHELSQPFLPREQAKQKACLAVWLALTTPNLWPRGLAQGMGDIGRDGQAAQNGDRRGGCWYLPPSQMAATSP